MTLPRSCQRSSRLNRPIRVEAARACALLIGEIHDPQHLLWRSCKRYRIRGRRNDIALPSIWIGWSFSSDPSILSRASETALLPSKPPRLSVQRRSGHSHVIGLNREDPCGRGEKVFVRQHHCSTGIGGDANILEQHTADSFSGTAPIVEWREGASGMPSLLASSTRIRRKMRAGVPRFPPADRYAWP
jgi:hypothetical protein